MSRGEAEVSCLSGKRVYLTPQEAHDAARYQQTRTREKTRASAYRCEKCHHWHLTHHKDYRGRT